MNKFLESNIKQGEQIREKILDFITLYWLKHCYAPSYKEISEGVGIAVSNVKQHVDKLFEAGLLETDLEDRHNQSRAYRVYNVSKWLK